MADDTDKPRRSCAGNILMHGVVGGDPSTAPRCGAATRRALGGRPCRGPAMRGRDRCRMHGADRVMATNLKHGAYSAATLELRAALKRSRAEAEELVARLLADADAADDTNTGAIDV
jgi:hypothetical protein